MIDHHAILLVGTSLAETGYVADARTGETELEFFSSPVLSIIDVRNLIKNAYRKPFSCPTKTIVIEVGSIAGEAQQALLKVLEEPPETTKFIIVVQSREGLLSTLLSRVAQPQIINAATRPHNELFSIFLKSSLAARLEVIAKVTKEKDNDNIEFLRTGVMALLEQKPLIKDAVTLSWCVSKLTQRGASKKMLLEEIALTLPPG